MDPTKADVFDNDSTERRASMERRRSLCEELEKRKEVKTSQQTDEWANNQRSTMKRLSVMQTFNAADRVKYRSVFKEMHKKVDDCLTKDPNLKEDQIKSILQSFSALDENGDGKISKQEIAKAYRLAGFNPTKAELDTIIKEHDENDDGFIDFEEYFNVMRTKMIQMDFEKDRLMTAFKVLDADQDGYITTEELERALNISGDHFTKEEIQDIIKKADKNSDGKIDYEEFVEAEMCKSVF